MYHRAIIGDVAAHGTTGAQGNVMANRNAGHNAAVRSDPHIVPDLDAGSMRFFAVIVFVVVGGCDYRILPDVNVVPQFQTARGVNINANIISGVAHDAFLNMLPPDDLGTEIHRPGYTTVNTSDFLHKKVASQNRPVGAVPLSRTLVLRPEPLHNVPQKPIVYPLF